MNISIKYNGTFIDKPKYINFELDETMDAVQLATGDIITVGALSKDKLAFDQYIYEKFIKNTHLDGRILEMIIIK